MKRLLPLLAALPLVACVATSKFQAQEAEAKSQRQRADNLDAQVKKTTADLDAANLKLKAAADQLAGLQVSNKDLQESLDANKSTLTKKVSDLIKERDALSAQLSDLTRQLAAAQADKKALEDAKAAELAQVKKSYEDLTSGLKSEISAGQVQITQLKGKLTVNMVDQILFDSGMAEVKADGKKVLEKVGGLLNQVSDKDIRIEGHTDNKPISGELKNKYASNWELSTARATAVARYLQDQAKVDPQRLVAAGYGEFRPKTSNETPELRAQNRRIEIILVPRD